MITLNLVWPPSVNHYWERNRNGSMRIGSAGIGYRQAVKLACTFQAPRLQTMTARLAVSIDAYPPDRRVRDLDNTLKATLDAMKHAGIYEDDSQVDVLSITRREVVKDGLLVVTIRALESEAATGS